MADSAELTEEEMVEVAWVAEMVETVEGDKSAPSHKA